MKPELVKRLNQINREFYSAFATSFSESRSESARELQVILPYIPDGARVLDIGCGNGRVALLLGRKRRTVMYVGVDASEEMIAGCRRQEASQISKSKRSTAFFVADIVQPGWADSLLVLKAGKLPEEEGQLGPGAFDCVLMLAVLHHIPGQDVRAQIMRQVRELLAPQGRIVISTWQFLENVRMQKKIVPWSWVGVDDRELEPGDTLLNWKRGGAGLRYCHWIGEDEMGALAGQAGLNVVETFRAGGREGNLSLYAILTPLSPLGAAPESATTNAAGGPPGPHSNERRPH
jgi:tRNA (uracil-5-)-methyltransferase TRM9